MKPDDRLDELGLDSFAAVEMIFDLEEKFDIQIPYNSNDSRLEYETVAEIADAIKKLTGKGLGLMAHRVVVTGWGVLSSIGHDAKTYWQNLTQEASAASHRP